MALVNIFAVFILAVSFFGGFKDGLVKQAFNLLILLIAVYLAGLSYSLIASIISFLPGTNWENFFGFFITFALITLVLKLALFIPGRILHAMWKWVPLSN